MKSTDSKVIWQVFLCFSLSAYERYVLEKSYTKYDGEASRRPFYKKSNLSISPEQQSEMLQSLFLLYVQVKIYQNILKLGLWPLSLFKKWKEGWNQPPCFIFWKIFKGKYFWWYILLYHQIYFLMYWAICVVINLLSSLWRHKSWN